MHVLSFQQKEKKVADDKLYDQFDVEAFCLVIHKLTNNITSELMFPKVQIGICII